MVNSNIFRHNMAVAGAGAYLVDSWASSSESSGSEDEEWRIESQVGLEDRILGIIGGQNPR